MAWEEAEAEAWEAAAARAFSRLLYSRVGWGGAADRRGRGLTRAGFRAKRGHNVVGAGDTTPAAALPSDGHAAECRPIHAWSKPRA